MSKYVISAGSYFKYAEICAKLGVDRNSGAVFIPEYELAGSNGLREGCEGLRAPDNKLIGYFSEFERFSLTRDSQDDLPAPPLTEVPEPTPKIEKFIVKHYSEDERPIIKGNGFDGLEIGSDREEAQEFIDFINNLIKEKK